MSNKDCHCKSNKDGITCESFLEGTFTDKNCNVFTATMSATGSGVDCESAKKDSEKNIKKTLEKFLKTHRPKIVKETHKIKTKCHGCDPEPKPTKGTLVVNLQGLLRLDRLDPTADTVNTYTVLYSSEKEDFLKLWGNNISYKGAQYGYNTSYTNTVSFMPNRTKAAFYDEFGKKTDVFVECIGSGINKCAKDGDCKRTIANTTAVYNKISTSDPTIKNKNEIVEKIKLTTDRTIHLSIKDESGAVIGTTSIEEWFIEAKSYPPFSSADTLYKVDYTFTSNTLALTSQV
jgi:hypothetical protein